jgi:hypothetical protein
MLVTEKIKQFNIVYDNKYTHSMREYYLYCIDLFKDKLRHCDRQANIIFGDFDYDFKNELPTKRVVFQFEHTLVKPGGRDSGGFPVGKIPLNNKDFYLVRLVNYDQIERSDLVVEYSIPNQFNVGNTDFFPYYNQRHLHISACLYHLDFGRDRPLDVVTNFYDVNQPRRYRLLQAASQIKNYTGVYGDRLAELYSSAKIVVNVHQTDHHDTLEELRVLPALRRGAIVISEHSALSTLIPYHNHIIWAKYEEIPDMIAEVTKNYEAYHGRVFNDSLLAVFRQLHKSNSIEIDRSVSCLH